MLRSSDIKTWCSWCKHNNACCSVTFAVFNGRVFKSHPLSVFFSFSCLVRTFPAILPRLLPVTSPKLGYLAKGLIRVMWLYLHPPEQCVFNSHQVPVIPFSCLVSTFLVILPRQLAVTTPNMEFLAKCLIRVMWLCLRPPEQCAFNSHQVPVFVNVYFSVFLYR